jgi:hypothetical protein
MVARVPLSVQPVDPPVDSVTAVVNLHGALILVPIPYPMGTTLEINNHQTGLMTHGRVIWVEPDASGQHKIGVEFESVVEGFWGDSYNPEEDEE